MKIFKLGEDEVHRPPVVTLREVFGLFLAILGDFGFLAISGGCCWVYVPLK